ncbi:2-succinylbenzoate--CoA ligase [termite gut metagenome]|uniref:2-succinylbenzoate--CoA ligase n=1 Tax=termite gut metagenome TaxID=433724 RepID=A0A5J4SPM9_9ZZZZ
MNTFLIDGNNRYSYDDLLHKINTSNAYYPLLKSNSLFDYFSNLILALVSDQPLTLLDSDLNSRVINGIEDKVSVAVTLEKEYFLSIENIIEKINISNSKITIFTSGTTGQPKEVIHSVSILTRSVRVSDYHKNQIWAFAYNPTHMAGLQVFFQVFENRNTFVNVFNASRTTIYTSIEKYQITHISATPTFYRLLLPVERSYNQVERVTLGGEKSDKKLYDSILQIFPNARINNIYASTEAGYLFVAKDDYFQIPESLTDKIKVEEEELLIHKSLLGFSNNFEFSGDYYKTGDLIEWVDKENGLFRFKSRKNELINVGGYKVNPDEVENILLQMGGIEQVVVYGKPNSVLGNILCADVKVVHNIELSELSIRQYLGGKLQDYKIPRKINFVDSFSLTRTGKTKRL